MGSTVDSEIERLRERIAEQEAKLRRLRESEVYLKDLVERFPGVVALLDADGVVRYGNRALSPESPATCVGVPVVELFSELQRVQIRDLLDRARTPGESVREEIAAGGVEKGEKPREYSVDPESGERMDAVARLAKNVAKEFSEVSLAVTTHSALALAGLAPDAPCREHLHELQESGKRAAELVRRLLDIGSASSTTVELVDLNDIVERFVSLVRRAMPANVELEFAPAPELSSITADPRLLEQVLLNLCVNARDAVQGGGRIVIGTENVVVTADWVGAPPAIDPGPYVVLSVSDDGVGMPKDVCERAFEPFFTTKLRGRSAGLGLSTAYGIVRSHRGTIRVRSEIGRGTTFEIYLPAVAARAPAADPRVGRARGAETILVVEDQADARQRVSLWLSHAGYRVVAVRDGLEAIRAFSDHLDDVSLVLMDLVLPKLDGGEAAERIRILDPHARILFARGSSEHSVASTNGTGPVFEKPYEADRLLRTIRGMLDADVVEK